MTRLLHALRRLFRGGDVTTCQRCAGSGTEPATPPRDLLEDRLMLNRAVLQLELHCCTDEARALRTLLERLDGAP